jgi:excisionase family DNA binding protein
LTYRLDEVAERVGLGQDAVWRWLRDANLPSLKINRLRRISSPDLQAVIDGMSASRGGPTDG